MPSRDTSYPGSFQRVATITRALAITDFKQRYAGSALGYVWSVSKPLLLFAVLYTVFTRVLRFGDGIEHYPAMLLFAIVLWSYFTEVTSGAVTVLVARGDVLRKIAIPRVALPLSLAVTGGLVMLFNLVAVAVFVLANGVTPTWTWLWLIPLLVELVILAVGTGLMLSVWYVNLRDIGQVWDLVLQTLFYATPIIYPITMASDTLQRILLLSPVAQIIQQSREALVGGQDSIGNFYEIMDGGLFLFPYAVVAIIAVFGVWSFHRSAPSVAERL